MHGSSTIDYKVLGEWVLSLPGQVIVCEGDGADWLPFKLFRRGSLKTGHGDRATDEWIWYREERPKRTVWPVQVAVG